jgi:pimeloyl-ACP methyl ester carboxylesterase
LSAADSPADTTDDWVQRMINQPGRPGKLDTAGHITTYLEWGDPASERVMVLLHGFLGHAHWWDFVAPWFADGYRVLAVDFAGMGDSEYLEHYVIGGFVTQVGAFLQAVSTPVTLIGHSFGGRVALHATHRYPERVARCIIVDSRIGFGERAPRPPTAPRPKVVYADLDTACARFRFRPDEPPVLPAIMRHLAEHSLKREAGGYVWKFDARLIVGIEPEGVQEADMLRGIELPMDFIAGELSGVVSSGLAIRICQALQRGRGPVVIPSAHHHIPANQPLALAAAIRALLA